MLLKITLWAICAVLLQTNASEWICTIFFYASHYSKIDIVFCICKYVRAIVKTIPQSKIEFIIKHQSQFMIVIKLEV